MRARLTGIVVAVAAAAGCEPARDRPTEVEDIRDDPARFVGQEVTLLGEVDAVHAGRAFELEERTPVFDDEVLVITRGEVKLGGAPLSDDDELVVVGTVQRLEGALLTEVPAEVGKARAGQPVVIATAIRRIAASARWSDDARDGVLIGLEPVLASLDPARLDGQRLELEDVPVRRVEPGIAWVGHNDGAQLAVKVPAGRELAVGDRVDVAGVLRAEGETLTLAAERVEVEPRRAAGR